jgi:hypothetical protein
VNEQSRILIDGNVPIPKVIAATTAGAITIVLVWVAGMLGVDVPEVVASAVTVLLMSVTAYVKR